MTMLPDPCRNLLDPRTVPSGFLCIASTLIILGYAYLAEVHTNDIRLDIDSYLFHHQPYERIMIQMRLVQRRIVLYPLQGTRRLKRLLLLSFW
jgi:hypothetical protein